MLRFIPLELDVILKTERQQNKDIWAENADEEFASVDPDLDTEHSLFVEDRYSTVGWQSGEKEPEQWQNFLQQITDLKITESMQYGLMYWYSDVQYHIGSVCNYNGFTWVALNENINTEPAEDSTDWDYVFSLSYQSYTANITELATTTETHLNAVGSVNPHEDDVTTIGGYTQDEIDYIFSPDNPDSFNHHINDKDNPHKVTWEQLNTLPTSGGIFTGVVTFEDGVNIGPAFLGWI